MLHTETKLARSEDRRLFGPTALPRLRAAVRELSWLLARGYSDVAALVLVGDRHQLLERQRRAVARCACSDQALAWRRSRALGFESVRGRPLDVDGYNVLTTVQVAMDGGLVLRGRDRCLRDLASFHGRRPLPRLRTTVLTIGTVMNRMAVSRCTWHLDRPVSHSGRLQALLVEVAAERHWNWDVALTNDPDAELVRAGGVVATSDGAVLDHCGRWFDLARATIEAQALRPLLVDLALGQDPSTS